jgi:hypothetical protein
MYCRITARQPLEIAMLVLFAILFAWISTGFWTAFAGFAVLVMGGDRHSILDRYAPGLPLSRISAKARTAIVMPICNEDVARVCGLAGDLRIAGANRGSRALRLLHPPIRATTTRASPSRCLAQMCARSMGPNACSIAGSSRINAERQHRGLLPPLGTRNFAYMIRLGGA